MEEMEGLQNAFKKIKLKKNRNVDALNESSIDNSPNRSIEELHRNSKGTMLDLKDADDVQAV